MSQFPTFRLVSWLLFCPLALVPACAANDDSAESSPEIGSLSLPLLTSVNGHTYRLSGSLYVQGPNSAWLDLGADSDVLSVQLNTGPYYAYLNYWQLSRDDGSGNFVNVTANLVSAAQVPFQIYDGSNATVTFTFETDSVIVKIGSGELDVRADVHETAAVCEPFGTACGEGAWCPPTELTGAPRACVATGMIGIGEACAGPLDCVVDSSCFDLGSGAVCTPLCPESLFGELCSEGVECVPAGSDYGICTPVLPEGE